MQDNSSAASSNTSTDPLSAAVEQAAPASGRYAGFWARFFASVLDSILQLVILTPIVFWLYGVEALTNPELDTSTFDLVSNVAVIVAILLFWHYRSATPGKMMMGLRIVDADTQGPVPFGRLVLRLLGYIVSMLPLFLGFIWVAFDKRKQGFHDKIARTVVLQGS